MLSRLRTWKWASFFQYFFSAIVIMWWKKHYFRFQLSIRSHCVKFRSYTLTFLWGSSSQLFQQLCCSITVGWKWTWWYISMIFKQHWEKGFASYIFLQVFVFCHTFLVQIIKQLPSSFQMMISNTKKSHFTLRNTIKYIFMLEFS